MPVTDREQLTRQAIDTILNADVPLQTVLGRATGLCIERAPFVVNPVVPIAVVDLAETDMGSGAISCVVDAVARDETGLPGGKRVREICEAVVNALTNPAFEAQSLPIVPLAEVRESVSPDEAFNAVNLTGDSTLHQARVSIPLLYME
jgi:hypothetical protein